MPASKRKELSDQATQSGFVMVKKQVDSEGRVRVYLVLM